MNHIRYLTKIINSISINNNNPSLLSVISYKPNKLIPYNKPSEIMIYKHQPPYMPKRFNKIMKVSFIKSK